MEGGSWDVKTEIPFVNPRLKMCTGDYIEQPEENILPSCLLLYLLGNVVLLQDWVPVHGIEARWKNVRLLRKEGR